MSQEIRCIVTGRVQMVMFRDFAMRKAKALNLAGEVKNLSDGSVEVIAQGQKDVLEKFIKQLEKGPLLANVARVDVEWKEPRDIFSDFNIIY